MEFISEGYVYIEESFDTISNMGYGSGKLAMDERVKIRILPSGLRKYMVELVNQHWKDFSLTSDPNVEVEGGESTFF